MKENTIIAETERVILRRYQESDLQDLYEYLSDPDVVKHEPYKPMSMDEVKGNLEWRISTDEMIAVELKSNHKMIGNVYLGKRDFESLEIGYVFNKNYWGKGYAKESCMKLIALAFSNGIHRIFAECDPQNLSSWNLLESLGFEKEAHLKKNVYFWTDENNSPIWKDTYIYAKLNVENMNRTIKTATPHHLDETLDLVEKVFTESEDEESGKLVRALVEEIRSKRFYVPELELIMVDEEDHAIGYAMFARFHLEGKYEDQLLLLSPVAVKTELQRQHISKELIEYGFEKAKEMGYEAVIVEGNPMNYNPRGFKTSCDYGITASPKIGLPAPECLMVKELVPGSLKNIKGVVDYSDYENLT